MCRVEEILILGCVYEETLCLLDPRGIGIYIFSVYSTLVAL